MTSAPSAGARRARPARLVAGVGVFVLLAGTTACGSDEQPAERPAPSLASSSSTSSSSSSTTSPTASPTAPAEFSPEVAPGAAPAQGDPEPAGGAVDPHGVAYCKGEGNGFAVLNNGLLDRRIECVDSSREGAGGGAPFQPGYTPAQQPPDMEGQVYVPPTAPTAARPSVHEDPPEPPVQQPQATPRPTAVATPAATTPAATPRTS